MNSTTQTSDKARASWITWMSLLKLAIVTLITFFIIKAIREGQEEFAKSNFSLSNIRYWWLFLASAAYIVGMSPMALNWHRLLVAMNQFVPRWDAVRAHYISQVGKYVPGKAFVVVIRLGLLAPFRLYAPTAIVSMMAEVLAMMSVGAVVAACVIAVQFRSRPGIALVAGGLALVSGLPVIPPVLRFVLRVLEKRRGKKTVESEDDVSSKLSWSVVIPGWIGIIPGWILLGVSMWATMKALNLPSTRDMSIWQLPWVTASYAISVIAGFASMLPGGMFVREWVMKQLIEPPFGTVVALLAPVLHRMVILMSESVLSGILYLGVRKSTPSGSTGTG